MKSKKAEQHKNLTAKKRPGSDGFQMVIINHFREGLTSVLVKFFQGREKWKEKFQGLMWKPEIPGVNKNCRPVYQWTQV